MLTPPPEVSTPSPVVYYNEYDPHAAAWLRALIDRNLIAPGHVDGRSILDVSPSDLKGYTQCHFFAGVGVWSYALRRAGWRDDQPVWTGSPPCQGFSAAGKGKGFEDERHLWPVLFRLIRECRPAVFFGEQVEAAIRFGWLDLVQADMEGIDYAFGAAGLPAAGFGAPHIRARLYFLGETDSPLHGALGPVKLGDTLCAGLEGHSRDGDYSDQSGRDGAVESGSAATAGSAVQLADANSGQCGGQPDGQGCGADWPTTRWLEGHRQSQRSGPGGGLANANDPGSQGRLVRGHGASECAAGPGGLGSGLANATREQHDGVGIGGPGGRTKHSDCSADGRMADAGSERRQQVAGSASGDEEADGRAGRLGVGAHGDHVAAGHGEDCRPGPTNGHWRAADWLFCRDGKWRPVEPGTFPLVDGAPARVGRLRGYGNAIVAQVAEAFVKSYMEVAHERSEEASAGSSLQQAA